MLEFGYVRTQRAVCGLDVCGLVGECGIMGALSEGAADALQDVMQQATATLGQSLIEDNNTPIVSQAQSYARGVCRLWARTPALDNNNTILGYNNFCKPYLDSLGESPTNGSLDTEQAQCPTFYTVTGTVDNRGSNGAVLETINFTSTLQGPALGPPEIVAIPGSWRLRQPDSSPTPGYANYVTRSSNFGRNGGNVRNVTYTRIDGLPDDCGQQSLMPPVAQSGLPAVPSFPDFPTPFGDRAISIALNPDGTITIDAGDGPVTISPPESGAKLFPDKPVSTVPQLGPTSGGELESPDSLEQPPAGFRWGSLLLEITQE
jgi:hypothetical protein